VKKSKPNTLQKLYLVHNQTETTLKGFSLSSFSLNRFYQHYFQGSINALVGMQHCNILLTLVAVWTPKPKDPLHASSTLLKLWLP